MCVMLVFTSVKFNIDTKVSAETFNLDINEDEAIDVLDVVTLKNRLISNNAVDTDTYTNLLYLKKYILGLRSNVTEPTTTEGATSETTQATDNKDLFNATMLLTLYSADTLIGTEDTVFINTSNMKIYVNGEDTGITFEGGYCYKDIQLDSWMKGDTAEINITGIPKYIQSVTYNEHTYTVLDGSVTFTVEATTDWKSEIHDGVEETYIYGNSVGLRFNVGTNILFLQVRDYKGNLVPNATVTGYFREYFEDGNYIEKNTVSYTTDDRGVVAIQGEASANTQQFCYTINSDKSVKQGKTKYFTLQDGIHSTIVELPYIGSLIDPSKVADEVDRLKEEAQNANSRVEVVTNFKNFDMSFTYPENLGLTISTEPTYNYSIQDFGTFDLGGILKGTYNVDYISDIYFKLYGANTVNVEGETTTIPVILTANYTMEVHKTVNGKEVEWSIENPLTGETITHTGLMTFAVQNGTDYDITNTKTGEVYCVRVGVDNAGATIDMGTGEITYTETAKDGDVVE